MSRSITPFRRFYILVASVLLALAMLPAWAATAARAEGADTSGPWYRYQGEPSSYDAANNQQVNCGPTSVAMAVQYVRSTYVPIRDVRRFIGKDSKYTSYGDVTAALAHWNVSYSPNIRGVDDIKAVVERGRIALVVLDMRQISQGADVNGRSTDPSLRTGRFETYAREHWLIVKGLSADGQYFIVYDGNVWGGPGSATYWYSDGTPKGLDRYYRVDEVARGMAVFGPGSVTGMEIISSRQVGAAPAASLRSAASSTPPVDAFVTVTPRDIALTRYVTLELGATDPEERVVGMMVSNNALFTDAFEEPFAATKQWTLTPGDGSKSVYVRFKNASGAWSRPARTEIRLEEQPPVGSVIAAPDPRIITALSLAGSPIASIGSQPRVGRMLSYQPLGPNLLFNSSFELWAGGVPDGWTSPLRGEAYRYYEPVTDVVNGATALQSAASGREQELTQQVIVQPDTSYVLSGWVKGAAEVVVEQLESQGVSHRSVSVHRKTVPPGSGWRLVQLRFRTASNATDVLVGLSGAGATFDAFQLEAGGKPSAYRPDGLLVEAPATNYIANPSLENGVERWSGLNSWVSVVTSRDYARFGSKALLVRKQKPGPAATLYPAASLRVGQKYTFSAYVRLDSGTKVSNDVVRGWLYQGVDSSSQVDTSRVADANRPEMIWRPVGGGWYRGSFTFTATATTGLFGVLSTALLGVGDVYYMDGVQVEEGGYPSSFVSGDQGSGYAWSGSPHRSPSTRSSVSLTASGVAGASGTLVFRARPFAAAQQGSVLLTLDDLQVVTAGNRLRLMSGGKTLAAAPWSRDSALQYAVAWTSSTVSLYRDGLLVGSARVPGPSAGSRIHLGPTPDGTSPNAVIGDVSLWKAPLSAAELAALARRNLLNPGRELVSSRLTTVAVGAWDPTDKGLRAEWSTDGVTWQPWDRAQGVHDWDLGASDGRKTVWVRYIDAAGNWMEYTDTITLDRTRPRVIGSRLLPTGQVELRLSESVNPAGLAAAARVTDARGELAGTWTSGGGRGTLVFVPGRKTEGAIELRITRALRDAAGNALRERYVASLLPR